MGTATRFTKPRHKIPISEWHPTLSTILLQVVQRGEIGELLSTHVTLISTMF